MIHNKRQKSAVMFLTTVFIIILGLRFCVGTLNAEIIADKSYAIAVDGENIDLDGTNNVVVYLKYTNSGEINASNINLTFQLDGSTENLLEAGAYTWDVEYHDAVMQSMFL